MKMSDSFFELNPEEEGLDLASKSHFRVLGILKSSGSSSSDLIITPDIVKKLVDNHIKVLVQRGVGENRNIKDMAYADVGAELYDDPLIIVSSSSILFKSSQFNSFELLLLKKEQTIVSYENFNDFILPDIQSLFEKKINALSYNLAIGKNGKSIVKSLEDSTLNAATKQALFSDFITPFLTSLIFNPFRYAVQTNLAILQSVYFYQGILTNKELAERFQLPWKDILLLCWNWN